jgi:uncharacterized protein YbaP (TraB family)
MFLGSLRRRQFKMVWRVEKDGKVSYLCGTAHFFPISLRKNLETLFERVEDVLFEGPLDRDSMKRIAEYGRQGEAGTSIYERLDPAVRKRINGQFKTQLLVSSSAGLDLPLASRSTSDVMGAYYCGLRPWVVFFHLWSSYLNWHYSIDMEAFQVAQRLLKRTHFLETMEEQLAALDGIPDERIIEYVNRFDQWKSYKKVFLDDFLEGNLDKLMSRTNRFPTRCESIFGHRDQRFFERARPFYERGAAVGFFGLSHIPAIRRMLIDAGYEVTQDVS